jgi:hypothetical protein
LNASLLASNGEYRLTSRASTPNQIGKTTMLDQLATRESIEFRSWSPLRKKRLGENDNPESIAI